MRLEESWGRLVMRYNLSQLATIKYGKNQKKVLSESGKYPIYGTGGLMGYATEFLYDKPSVLIGRKGTIDKVRFVTHPFWTVDTLFYTIINEEIIRPRYFYYIMNQVDLLKLNEGTTIPSLRTETLNRIEFDIPSLEIQDRVISIVYPMEEKINLNTNINKNLLEQATTLFQSWFINYTPWSGVKPSNWEEAPLGSFVEIKRGGSPRPIHEYMAENGLHWLKISDVTSLDSPYVLNIKEYIKEEGLRKTVLLKSGSLVLSNSATPGIPKILDIDTCVHDGWLYFPKSFFSNYYLYLLFLSIRPKLLSLGNGSIFTNLKTDILKAYTVVKADDITLNTFDEIVAPMFETMLNIARENNHLKELQNSLLDKLMSGEIDVSSIEN